jgi:hypothetical protein
MTEDLDAKMEIFFSKHKASSGSLPDTIANFDLMDYGDEAFKGMETDTEAKVAALVRVCVCVWGGGGKGDAREGGGGGVGWGGMHLRRHRQYQDEGTISPNHPPPRDREAIGRPVACGASV